MLTSLSPLATASRRASQRQQRQRLEEDAETSRPRGLPDAPQPTTVILTHKCHCGWPNCDELAAAHVYGDFTLTSKLPDDEPTCREFLRCMQTAQELVEDIVKRRCEMKRPKLLTAPEQLDFCEKDVCLRHKGVVRRLLPFLHLFGASTPPGPELPTTTTPVQQHLSHGKNSRRQRISHGMCNKGSG